MYKLLKGVLPPCAREANCSAPPSRAAPTNPSLEAPVETMDGKLTRIRALTKVGWQTEDVVLLVTALSQ